MVAAISVSISGRNQSASGTKPKAAAISEIEWASVKAVTRITSGRRRRKGRTRQSRNRRWSMPSQDVPEAGDARSARRPGASADRGARGPGRRGTRRRARRRPAAGSAGPSRPAAEAVDARVDGEVGAVRPDRVFQQHVEQLLVPVEVEVVGEARPLHVRERLLVGGERAVGGQRHAHGRDARRTQARVVLVEVDVVDEPELGRVAQRLVGAREVEIARAAGRELHLAAWPPSARGPGARAGCRPA